MDKDNLTPAQTAEINALSYKIYCHAIDLVGEVGEDGTVSVRALSVAALALIHAAAVMEKAVIEIAQ